MRKKALLGCCNPPCALPCPPWLRPEGLASVPARSRPRERPGQYLRPIFHLIRATGTPTFFSAVTSADRNVAPPSIESIITCGSSGKCGRNVANRPSSFSIPPGLFSHGDVQMAYCSEKFGIRRFDGASWSCHSPSYWVRNEQWGSAFGLYACRLACLPASRYAAPVFLRN